MIWLLWALGDRCEPAPESLDYSAPELWICQPGRDDVCGGELSVLAVSADGQSQTQALPPAQEQPVDCFYVYPTMDLRMGLGVHEDLADMQDAERAALWQLAHLRQGCNTWAPAYRQATIGTYLKRPARSEPCLDRAYQDALDAFEHYLRASDKPFVLLGHSQGAQHVYRLLRERIHGDPALEARLVAAWTLGSPTQDDSPFPACQDDTQWGCVVAARTYLQGNIVPSFPEGTRALQCDNPAALGSSEWAPLPQVVIPAEGPWALPKGVSPDPTLILSYDGLFEGRCQQDALGYPGLQVRWTGPAFSNPVPQKHGLTSGVMGTHVLDFSFTQYALLADLRQRTASLSPPSTP